MSRVCALQQEAITGRGLHTNEEQPLLTATRGSLSTAAETQCSQNKGINVKKKKERKKWSQIAKKGLFLKRKKKNSTYIYIYIYVDNHHVLIVLLQQPSNPYPHIHPTTSVSKYQIMFYPQIFQYVLFIIYICIFGCAGPSLLHVLSSSCGE